MKQSTIKTWEDVDPRQIYDNELAKHPAYFDDEQQTWMIYAFDFCKKIFDHSNARIPDPIFEPQYNSRTISLITKLARLNNGEQHTITRYAAESIYKTMTAVDVSEILLSLLPEKTAQSSFDWIAAISKKLPAMVLAAGFQFNDQECIGINEQIGNLVRLMAPVKRIEDIELINRSVDFFYQIASLKVNRSTQNGTWLNKDEQELEVFNMIGLFIQCYDAGRGLLSNLVVQMLQNRHLLNSNFTDVEYARFVTEVLRFDPPVHTTRRIAIDDLQIGEFLIRRGEKICLVLASANIDPEVFEAALSFNPYRHNNNKHLAFGAGGHMCIAKHLMVNMGATVAKYLTTSNRHITIEQGHISYEPQLNVRLIKELQISLTPIIS